jgi:hypothetical protein
MDPRITSVSPREWCSSGITNVTITGTNFGVKADMWSYISVFFNERASPITIASITDTQIISGYLPSHIATRSLSLFLAWNDPEERSILNYIRLAFMLVLVKNVN